jgi:hypothetical protein
VVVLVDVVVASVAVVLEVEVVVVVVTSQGASLGSLSQEFLASQQRTYP